MSQTNSNQNILYLGAAAFLILLVVVVALSVARWPEVLVGAAIVAIPVVLFTIAQSSSKNDNKALQQGQQRQQRQHAQQRQQPKSKQQAMNIQSAPITRDRAYAAAGLPTREQEAEAKKGPAGIEVINPDLGLRLADWFCDTATEVKGEQCGAFIPGPGRRTADSVLPQSERGKIAGQVLASGNQEAIAFFRDQNALAMARNMKLGAHIPNTNPSVARTNWSLINFGKVWGGKFERPVDPSLIDNTPEGYY